MNTLEPFARDRSRALLEPFVSIEDLQGHLGKLGVIALQIDRAEQQILWRAEHRLAELEITLSTAWPADSDSDELKQHFTGVLEECAQLRQVILIARQALTL